MKNIRLAKLTDAKVISEIYGKYVSDSAISFELEAPTEREMRGRIETILSFAPWLVCEDDEKVLGYAYASKHRDRAAYQWCVDTAVYIHEEHHRCGVGRALYSSLIECLKIQGFYAAHAGVTLPNSGSVGLHESMGFQKIGVYSKVGFKQGAWHDVGWWQLPLRDRTGPPQTPLSMKEVQALPQWGLALAKGLSTSI